jgi:hypothetical protein
MRPTIRDVAKKLNLSITTVSRALDGYDDVAEQTRQLVMEAAKSVKFWELAHCPIWWQRLSFRIQVA